MDIKSIAEIKQEMNNTSYDNLNSFIDLYASDERGGVIKLVETARKRIDKYNAEIARVTAMMEFEHKYQDYEYICGIDEVGRGPLAGPVCAAAVILPQDCLILGINDSKKLSEKKREELYDEIMNKAISVGIAMKAPEVIDQVNILQATYLAMQDAVAKLDPEPNLLLNDAVTIPNLTQKQVAIIKGDAKSQSIAAASIIAKVTRDRLMYEYDKLFPEYGFASNKGYGTADHIAALKKYGPTEIHRRSFIGNFV